MKDLLARLITMPIDQLDALLPTAPAPETLNMTTVTGQVTSLLLKVLHHTPVTTNVAQIISPRSA